LTQIVSGHPFLRGTLQERYRVCGKSNCRCAQGQKHRGLYLVWREGRRLRQLYVPPAWEKRVREWVTRHQVLRKLICAVAGECWKKVERRED
jgi:hypothetical protein